MRLQMKTAINNMRIEGIIPAEIARRLNIPDSTVRTFIRSHPEIPNTKCCEQCGKFVVQQEGRKPKRFCSDACRNAWWNSNQDKVNKKAYYTLVCKQCGKEFESYGNKNRKYCCRQCYIESRRQGAD